ncbi:flagellar protein FlgN [Dechloromonas sp. XY25]|uniref:Flagellar protein FlgN n=1 Tax=Dechloromonas hankyongensis TaxID=2908002 RepID=A0ABS9K6P1_9RHOO|nr:flagellar protein FlgN [Dechloromonas hankyongensis]MCG2578833.1 flagellar protein FlgN [Dechloromonas hankyongensis]
MVAGQPVTQQEVALLGDFIALLKQEQEALVRADPGSLSDINNRKLILLADLDRHEQIRAQILKLAPGENTREAMSQWLAVHPDQKATADTWLAVKNLAREAKRLHDLNGQLIAMHLQRTSELLAVLKRSEHQTLYGANGQTHQSSGSRIIDQA